MVLCLSEQEKSLDLLRKPPLMITNNSNEIDTLETEDR